MMRPAALLPGPAVARAPARMVQRRKRHREPARRQLVRLTDARSARRRRSGLRASGAANAARRLLAGVCAGHRAVASGTERTRPPGDGAIRVDGTDAAQAERQPSALGCRVRRDKHRGADGRRFVAGESTDDPRADAGVAIQVAAATVTGHSRATSCAERRQQRDDHDDRQAPHVGMDAEEMGGVPTCGAPMRPSLNGCDGRTGSRCPA